MSRRQYGRCDGRPVIAARQDFGNGIPGTVPGRESTHPVGRATQLCNNATLDDAGTSDLHAPTLPLRPRSKGAGSENHSGIKAGIIMKKLWAPWRMDYILQPRQKD